MKVKKITRKILYIIGFLFITFNVIAYIQAYRFTHFSEKPIEKTSTNNNFLHTLKTLATGVDNPRPENTMLPNLEYETIHIQSNVDLECWSIPVVESKGTVILFHGYATSKSSMLERAYILHNMGYSTLLVDFMGSGESEGNITTIGYREAENVESAFKYIKSKGEKHIFLLGTSMGAVAIMKAINDYSITPNGIIIECPYATMIETISIRFKLMGLPPTPTAHALAFWGGLQHGFNAFTLEPVEYAKKVDIPSLLIYGANDEKVASDETQRIYKNLNGKKRLSIYPHSSHADYLSNEEERWIQDVANFLKENR